MLPFRQRDAPIERLLIVAWAFYERSAFLLLIDPLFRWYEQDLGVHGETTALCLAPYA
jgi:hypothetical protein